MKKNMGTIDRLLRFVVGAALVILYLSNSVIGALGVVLLIVGAVFVLTSFVSWCPGYVPLGVSTKKDSDGPSAAA